MPSQLLGANCIGGKGEECHEFRVLSSGCLVGAPCAPWSYKSSVVRSVVFLFVTEALTLAQSAQDQFNEPRMKKGRRDEKNEEMRKETK